MRFTRHITRRQRGHSAHARLANTGVTIFAIFIASPSSAKPAIFTAHTAEASRCERGFVTSQSHISITTRAVRDFRWVTISVGTP